MPHGEIEEETGKDGVKRHKDWQKNMGNVKMLTANLIWIFWIFFFCNEENGAKCELDSLRLCVMASGRA